MNIGSWIVLAILAVIVGLAVRSIAVNGIDSCSGECGSCGTSCKWVNDIQKAKKAAERNRKIKAFFGIRA